MKKKINGFEKVLGKTDLIYRYSINKIDKDLFIIKSFLIALQVIS